MCKGLFSDTPCAETPYKNIQHKKEKSRRKDEKKEKKVGEKFVFREKRGILY